MLRKVLIAVGIVALPMAMLYPLWSCPTSAGEDDIGYYYPLRVMVAEQVRAGQWPAWNAREGAGVPLFGDPQSGLFYPANLLFLVLAPKTAYALCIFLAFATAGGGAWLYLRRLGLAAPAAALGTIAFTFGGFLVGHRVHLSMIQAAALLPWGLWAMEGIRSGRRRPLLWMAPIFALTLAAGHWPTAIHMTIAWAAYMLLRARPLGRALAVAAASVAVAVALMAPQIIATAQAIGTTVRSALPYSVATENSFNPVCAALALYPFLMGCRTPNFFPAQWWGPWHLCEMLGYVGLVTLILAVAAAWRLGLARCEPVGEAVPDDRPDREEMRRLVRVWIWILIGAGLWALGRYLPTYRLIHRIPVLGVVRCPARMLLVIDMGLAVLAASAAHVLCSGRAGKLGRTVRRLTLIGLPVGLAAVWLLVRGGAALIAVMDLAELAADRSAMAQSLSPASPSVWIPWALAGATIAVLLWFMARPRPRAWALTVLLLADLFFLARFVDVPSGSPPPDPDYSPAAAWLKANVPADEPYRVWGLARSYHDRPAELLGPKACATLGIETISQYGPFQPAEHPRLFGFRPWGENYEWPWLLRTNHLLSLFNVRYIVAADPAFRDVIESVRTASGEPEPLGQNELRRDWSLDWSLEHATQDGDVIRLRRPALLWAAQAGQYQTWPAVGTLRISLDARAPQGAENFVAAEYRFNSASSICHRLRIDPERLGPDWRHFELTFRCSAGEPGGVTFRLLTFSEKPIEVRNVRLFTADWEAPVGLPGRLAPGQLVYEDLTPAGLPALNPADPPVHIYLNRLCLPRRFPVEEVVRLPDEGAVIEALRWRAGEYDLARQVLTAAQAGDWPDAQFISISPVGIDEGRRANAMGVLVRRAGDVRREGMGPGAAAAAAMGGAAWLAVLLAGPIWRRLANRRWR